MAGELAAEWIRIPDGNGNLQKVWIRDSTARRDIAQLQTDVSGKADAATTLAGYGITDAYTKTQVDGMIPSVPSAYTSNPSMDGTASPGSSTAWARGDHVHPHDSTKADVSAIPTKTSDLTNDSGFITSAPVTSVNGQTGAVVLTASDVGAMPDSTTIPTKTSDLTNDSGYITGYTETDPTVPSWAKASSKPTYTAAEVGALPSSTVIPSKTSDLTNDSGFITGYTETDPTVPAWAKAANKPTYTASEVGALPDTTPIPTVPTNVSAFTNDAGYLTSYTETDPTVPNWAKASTKPTYTASEVGALPSSTVIPSKTSDLTNDSGFITSNKFAVVSCTFAASTAYGAYTPLPDGFTYGNCVILSVQVPDGSGERVGQGIYTTSNMRLFAEVSANGVRVLTNSSRYYSVTAKVTLMRTDI